MEQKVSKKIIRSWITYDWANSAYSLVIASTMLPAYYESITHTPNGTVEIFGREYVNTALYNYALSIAFLIVAILSPILSSIADYKGNKRAFLNFFCFLGSMGCMGLFFFDKQHIEWGLFQIIVACIGFWLSSVFYNAYLPEIAPPQERDRLSAKGYAWGYVGCVLQQILCFILLYKRTSFGIAENNEALALQISFLMVGLWWLGFGQLAINGLPKIAPHPFHSQADKKHNIIFNGYRELRKVWIEIKKMKVLKNFLLAFFFYNMGVQTIMLAAALFGKIELEIPTTNLILSILIIQLIAIPGALLIAKLSSKIGNFKALMYVITVWIGMCIMGYLIPKGNVYAFYALAALVGFVMGGIQSLSRSTYSKLLPNNTLDTTSFFSFYDVTEKIAIVIGMFTFGYVVEIAGGSQRNSVLLLVVFFLIGLCLLYRTFKLSKRHHYENTYY